jgi:hypothetical protein
MANSLIPGLKSEQARKALSEAVTEVLSRWQLTDDDQAMLLGLPDPARLADFREGEPLPDDPELLERVGHLLAVHRALNKIYGGDQILCNRWMRAKDPLLGRPPLEVVREAGLEGLIIVQRALESG